VSAPRNDPPILSNLDFTITGVDGSPVIRETIPTLVDEMPGVLVAAGTHRFQAKVIPHRRLPGMQATLVSFVATTEPGKVYMLVDKDDAPILVLSHSRPRP